MQLSDAIIFAGIGLCVGTFSGMLGIGGGVLVIPLLVILSRFDQKMAVGTSLGMLLPPIGIFAVLNYYKAGQINIPAAAILAATFAVGAWLGSSLVQRIPEQPLRLIFCGFMLYVVGNMLFRGERRVWAALSTVVLMGAFMAAYWGLRMLGRRWERPWKAHDVFRRRVEGPVAMDYEI